MATFIEVNQGIFIKSDSIDAVVDTEFDPDYPEILCRVYTATETFPSVLPSSVILEMIGVREEKPEQVDEGIQQQMLNIAKQQTNFSG